MRFLAVFSALLVGAGLAAALTAVLSYFTRYSMFDALYGEIDSTLYLRITAMTSFEKIAIVWGIAAAFIGIAVAVAHLVRVRRLTNS